MNGNGDRDHLLVNFAPRNIVAFTPDLFAFVEFRSENSCRGFPVEPPFSSEMEDPTARK